MRQRSACATPSSMSFSPAASPANTASGRKRRASAQSPRAGTWCYFGDVAEFEQGGTPSKSRPEFWEGDIPFVTGADLRYFRINRDNARSFLTDDGLNSGTTVICVPGSLLLATRTRVGLAGIATETMGASQDITLVKAGDSADTTYLCRLLISHADKLQRMSRGTTIQGISREDVTSFSIVLPPLMEQQAIAAALDGVDEAIEQTRQERNGLQLLKASAADALLTGRVRVGLSR